METTKKKLTPYAEEFFHNLSTYLNTKIYYYGSVQRDDYFPKSSDIDVGIFTINDSSTITQLQNILGVEKSEFKKFIYNLSKTKKVVHGKKLKYEDPSNELSVEISIFAEKDKEDILKEQQSIQILPFYVSGLLIVLKFLYYNLGILSKHTFKYLKRKIMQYLIEGQEFVITEIEYTPKN
jgi:predicted nucleotidyltransferase